MMATGLTMMTLATLNREEIRRSCSSSSPCGCGRSSSLFTYHQHSSSPDDASAVLRQQRPHSPGPGPPAVSSSPFSVKKNTLNGLWQHLLVFVFGPRDDMSDVAVEHQQSHHAHSPLPDHSHEEHDDHYDDTTVHLHTHQTHQPHTRNAPHNLSPIVVAPARRFDFVVTAPTPPADSSSSSASGSSTSRTPNEMLCTSTTPGGASGSRGSSGVTTSNGTLRRAASDKPQYLSPGGRVPHPKRQPRHKTISDVTAEARKVLEQLIMRSETDSSTGVTPVPTSGRPTTLGVTSRAATSTEAEFGDARGLPGAAAAVEGGEDDLCGEHHYQHHHPHGAAEFPHRPDAVAMPDDDATSHSPVSGPNSTYSFSSRSSSNRNRIQLMTHFTDEAQLKRHAKQQQQRQKKKKKRKARQLSSASGAGARRDSAGSSSSSEYEIVNGQLHLRDRRRPKSFFKRAKERLRQSFRRKREPFDPYSIDDEVREAEANTPPAGASVNGSAKRGGFRLSLRPQKSSDKSRRSSADRSPIGADRGFHSDAAAAGGTYSTRLSYCPVHDYNNAAHPRRQVENGAAVPVRDAVIGPAAVEKEKHRSLIDSILRTLRRGGEKLKRRGSQKDTDKTAPPRSRSADAITLHGTTATLRHAGSDATSTSLQQRHPRPPHHFRKSAPQEVETSVNGGGAGRGIIYCRCHSLDSGTVPGGSGRVVVKSAMMRPRPPPLPALMSAEPTPDGDDDVDYVPDAVMRDIDLAPPGGGSALLQVGGGLAHSSHLAQRETDELDGVDQVDSGSPNGPVATQRQQAATTKPFAEKTEAEKDELFAMIAEQLAAIADNYNLESPHCGKTADLFFSRPASRKTTTSTTSTPRSAATTPAKSAATTTVPKSASAPLPAPTETTSPVAPAQTAMRTSLTVPVTTSEALAASAAAAGVQEGATGEEGAVERGAHGGRTPIEQKIGKILRDKGDKAASKDLSDLQPAVTELVRNASYSRFQQIIHENVGSEAGWQQVALVFNLTRSAVQLAGFGTASALQIKELTLRYFEDRFAGWIVGQGGWESMVEDTDLSSEVD